MVYQHVPVERCQRLIADVTGAQVSAGFVHSCLARAAGLIADVVRLIRTLITAAHVAGFDETTLRCGPAGQKRYVLAAVTERYSLFFLGRRALESFRDFGILPAFGGVVVSDRYANYFHSGWEHIAGNQACLAHLIRDYQDAAECYPAAIWPVQAQRALRDLIRGWHAARDAGQPEIPPGIRDPLLREFRHVVLAGLSDVRRVPGPKSSTAQHPRPGPAGILPRPPGGRDPVLLRHPDLADEQHLRARRPARQDPAEISGRLTSEDIAQDRLDIRSYIDAARKHGCNVMDILRNVTSSAPWSPPVPAPA